jgi:hypothetical protein
MLPRWALWLPGVWLGILLCIALIAAPAAFGALPAADAGRVVSRIFVQEGWLSLALAVLLLLLQRRPQQRGLFAVRRVGLGNATLLWVTVLCTLLGYFAVQALLPSARSGQGPLSFGQLHAVSTVFYAVKTLAVAALAWRAARG